VTFKRPDPSEYDYDRDDAHDYIKARIRTDRRAQANEWLTVLKAILDGRVAPGTRPSTAPSTLFDPEHEQEAS
jgi:hypothetical protein